VDTGLLKPDSHQQTIIQKLQRLWTELKTYDPGEISSGKEEIRPSFVCSLLSSHAQEQS
jgi:protein AFG1